MSQLERPISQGIYEKLCKVIPYGVNSPVRAFKGIAPYPMVVDSGSGALIKDADGHEFIDYCNSWGALIHGHAHPDILDAVYQRMKKGTSFGITTSIEEQLASKITGLVKSVEKIRFVSSGTEATMSAVRLARGFTGRDLIIKFAGHYHGHADFFLVQAGSGVFTLNPQSSSAGVPQEIVQQTVCLPFNDVEAVRNALRDPEVRTRIAGVILEPISGNMGVVPACEEFIQMLREETKKIGAVLIFDEVITGFRVGKQGAQHLYTVKSDLTCLGKIIGGGFPAAAFGGRAEIMDFLAPNGPVYQAGTLSGNPVAMEAGLQALNLLDRDGFYEELEEKTKIITEPVSDMLKQKKVNACLQRVGSMFTLFFGKTSVKNAQDAREVDLEQFAHFFRYLFDRGVYIPPAQHEAWFISMAHQKKHLEKTRDLILEYFECEK